MSRWLLDILGNLLNFSGKSAPVLFHPHSKKVFPYVQMEPPVFQLGHGYKMQRHLESARGSHYFRSAFVNGSLVCNRRTLLGAVRSTEENPWFSFQECTISAESSGMWLPEDGILFMRCCY